MGNIHNLHNFRKEENRNRQSLSKKYKENST
jgi:hypothetical protein